MHTNKKLSPVLLIFLAIELALYCLILTSGGNLLVWSSFISIVLCFLFAVFGANKSNALVVSGLFFTVLADFCLVVCDPMQQLLGMVSFLLAQSCYAVMLHRQGQHKAMAPLRLSLVILVEVVAVVVLRDKTDALALVSMAYYVNLIMNLICAFSRFKENKLLAIGFICFLLCDTVIGLQMAAGVYFPIVEDSLIYRVIYMDFHLSWFFYLPSQVMIALTARKLSSN